MIACGNTGKYYVLHSVNAAYILSFLHFLTLTKFNLDAISALDARISLPQLLAEPGVLGWRDRRSTGHKVLQPNEKKVAALPLRIFRDYARYTLHIWLFR